MIKIENIETYGWEAALRGMRNPMNSWDKSDTVFHDELVPEIGANDYALLMKLARAGTDHAKYRRMIIVTLDITAPLYWWKEFDTYKVGTVANSCSTMLTIHKREFELDDFSHEKLIANEPVPTTVLSPLQFLSGMVNALNGCRDMFLTTKDKRWWEQMIQLLPSSYNQKRTVQLNYEVLSNMYHSREAHKLDEWRTFCEWVARLPYPEIITDARCKS